MTTNMVGDKLMVEPSSDDYDKVVFTWNAVQVRAEGAHTGGCINLRTHALRSGDGSLLQGLSVQNMYMELRQGSKNAVVVARNSTAYPQTLHKKTPVARAVVANPVPRLPMESQLQEGGDKSQDPDIPN